MAVQYMRRVIEKKAKFDIMDLNCLPVAPKTSIPALFGHAKDDLFIQPHHTDLISKAYAGEKTIIKFDGDHNSSRPQHFFDSVSLFFYNVLHPPPLPKARKPEKYYDLASLKLGSGVDESLLRKILCSLQSATTDAASSSSTAPSISIAASIGKLLSEVAPVTTADSMVKDDSTSGYDGHGHDEPADFKDELNVLTGDSYSCTSSTRESWGRCSTLGHGDEESIADFKGDDNSSEIFVTPMGSMREQFTPMGSMREQLEDPKEDEKSLYNKADAAKKVNSLSRRLRRILKGSSHRRYKSS